ncbi:hypothetical protein ES703_37659 [subsurface metagenome]
MFVPKDVPSSVSQRVLSESVPIPLTHSTRASSSTSFSSPFFKSSLIKKSASSSRDMAMRSNQGFASLGSSFGALVTTRKCGSSLPFFSTTNACWCLARAVWSTSLGKSVYPPRSHASTRGNSTRLVTSYISSSCSTSFPPSFFAALDSSATICLRRSAGSTITDASFSFCMHSSG